MDTSIFGATHTPVTTHICMSAFLITAITGTAPPFPFKQWTTEVEHIGSTAGLTEATSDISN